MFNNYRRTYLNGPQVSARTSFSFSGSDHFKAISIGIVGLSTGYMYKRIQIQCVHKTQIYFSALQQNCTILKYVYMAVNFLREFMLHMQFQASFRHLLVLANMARFLLHCFQAIYLYETAHFRVSPPSPLPPLMHTLQGAVKSMICEKI